MASTWATISGPFTGMGDTLCIFLHSDTTAVDLMRKIAGAAYINVSKYRLYTKDGFSLFNPQEEYGGENSDLLLIVGSYTDLRLVPIAVDDNEYIFI